MLCKQFSPEYSKRYRDKYALKCHESKNYIKFLGLKVSGLNFQKLYLIVQTGFSTRKCQEKTAIKTVKITAKSEHK